MTKKEIAKSIDHTLLAPDAGKKDIIQLCQEALRYDFASVCVNPLYVTLASEQLKSSDVKVCTVIGFPLGAVTSYDKAMETKKAIKNGADEVDMVIDIGAAKEERYTDVKRDISAVVKAARTAGKAVNKKVIVKVILETCLLSDENIENCCICAEKAGADFVKTSTGFASPKGIDGNPLPNGANEHHVSLMKKTVGKKMKVKASGGIRSPRVVIAMLEAGAARIGTSSGASIVENWNEDLQINLPE